MIAELFALASDQNTLIIALLIPILGVLSPLLIASQINRNARATKKLDWERQDEVASRAEAVALQAAEAAKLVVERQDALDIKTDAVAAQAASTAELVVERHNVLDKKTDEVARLVASSTSETNQQLATIHGLVNSQMTQAIRSELDATRDTLALMSEVIVMHKKAGVEPNVEVMAAFRGREAKIKELAANLEAREKADAESLKQSQIKAQGPTEVVIVNPDPVPVVTEQKEKQEVIISNPDPVPVTDVKTEDEPPAGPS